MSTNVTTAMLLPGETTYEAAERIRRIRVLRRERRAPIDKLVERDRLVKLWKVSYPMHQPELCRIKPSFALVHVGSFRRGLLHGHLSLLPGRVPAHLQSKYRRHSKIEPRAQGDLFAA
ncbi:hypothetical protein [Paraburkholderia sp. EG304]|uniref:hypothetical protein n=1 Tax=Paraburkholderia sp. EG304 TaxID=3237015 RepID=UPI00397992CF